MPPAAPANPNGDTGTAIDSQLPNPETHDQLVQHASPDPDRSRQAPGATRATEATEASSPPQQHALPTTIPVALAPEPTSLPSLSTSSSPDTPPPAPAAATADSLPQPVQSTSLDTGDDHPSAVAPKIIRHLDPLLLDGTSSPLLSPAARTASRSPTRSSSPHSTSYIKPTPPPSPRVTQSSLAPPPNHILSSLRKSLDDAVESLPDSMLFGQSTERRRRAMANTNALTEYEADMTGRDRVKQKAAIQKFLAEKIKHDWEWPQAESGEAVNDAQLEPNMSASSHSDGEWRVRVEGESDMSDSESDLPMPTSPFQNDRPDSAISKAASKGSPFRFDSPDGVGEVMMQQEKDRKRRRRKRLADEMAINEGLNCFIHRRDAWTGARKSGQRKPRSNSAQPAAADDGSSTAVDSEDPDSGNVESDWDCDMEVPVAPPLLPAENGMRASIGPPAYATIYDKVIVQQLSPSCPINLKDITRSCVQGWKKDGEWPPRPTPAEGAGGGLSLLKKKRRKGSLAGILGLSGDKDESTSPKSPSFGGRFKKILGIGKEKEIQEAHNENGNGIAVKV